MGFAAFCQRGVIQPRGPCCKQLSALPGCQPKAPFAFLRRSFLPAVISPPRTHASRRPSFLTCAVKGRSHRTGGGEPRPWGPLMQNGSSRNWIPGPLEPSLMPTAIARMSFLPPGGAGRELLGIGQPTTPWDDCTTPVANRKEDFFVWLSPASPPSPLPCSQPRKFMSVLVRNFLPKKSKFLFQRTNPCRDLNLAIATVPWHG